MSPALAGEILETTFANDKELYRAVLAAVAQARRVRPVFLEKQPRTERHPVILNTLTRPGLDEVAGNLIRGWLMRKRDLLTQFLDTLGVPHKNGVIDDLPDVIEDEKLEAAINKLLENHPPELVVVYLHIFHGMNDRKWAKLDTMLQSDPRLELGK